MEMYYKYEHQLYLHSNGFGYEYLKTIEFPCYFYTYIKIK